MQAQAPAPPFPILPPAIQICSILGALYPHFDIVDDVFIVQTGSKELEQSLHAMGLGCCMLLLGYYCCQFLLVLRPLRREYLGCLALMQVVRLGLLVAQAVLFTNRFLADPQGAVLAIAAAVCMVVLVLNDKAAEPAVLGVGGKPQQPSAGARRAVAVATHVMWLSFTLLYIMPYVAPILGLHVRPPMPYGGVAAVVAQVAAVSRLAVFVAGRVGAARQKAKSE